MVLAAPDLRTQPPSCFWPIQGGGFLCAATLVLSTPEGKTPRPEVAGQRRVFTYTYPAGGRDVHSLLDASRKICMSSAVTYMFPPSTNR